MRLPIFHVDAFTTGRFTGNPAAVVVLEEWLPTETLQSIASENNLSETAFVIPGEGENPLRWFSPQVEVELCGHATLATAHVLFRHGYAASAEVVFRYQGGILRVTQEAELLCMDFPALPAERIEDDIRVSEGLRARPSQLLRATNVMAVFDDQAQIEALHPDFSVLASLETFGVIVTAPGRDCDFVSRFFTPGAGVSEDPVTGSAHCTSVPYWSERLGKDKLHAKQVSARGGELFCEDRGDRVLIAGRAREYLVGEIELD